MSIKTVLNEEILSEIEELNKVAVGTDEHKAAVDALAKLLDKSIEMDRVDLEYQDKYDSRVEELDLKREELELKKQQEKHEKRDQMIKNGLTAVSVIGGFALTVWGTKASFKFEKDGVITTIMGRGFIQKLLPKK